MPTQEKVKACPKGFTDADRGTSTYCNDQYCGLHCTRPINHKGQHHAHYSDGAMVLADYAGSIEDLLDEVLFKGFDKDSIKAILKANPIPKGLK